MNLTTFYDLLIAIILSATLLPGAILFYTLKKRPTFWISKHKKLGYTVTTLLLLAAATTLYGSFIEPHFLVTNEQTIDLPGIDEPFTIALVADFQAGPYKRIKDVDKIIDRIISLHPDMVVMAGDQVDNVPLASDETVHLTPFEKLIAAGIPTYAVNGNHERGASITKQTNGPMQISGDISEHVENVMQAMGVSYLDNRLVTTTLRGNDIAIFGGDSYWAGKLRFDVLEEKDENLPTIAIIHNPAAAWLAAEEDIDLILAGHTHGGQIRLPFIGPVGRVDGITPLAWYQGLVDVDSDTQMYVTSGAGETGVRARLFNPPEVVLITVE